MISELHFSISGYVPSSDNNWELQTKKPRKPKEDKSKLKEEKQKALQEKARLREEKKKDAEALKRLKPGECIKV